MTDELPAGIRLRQAADRDLPTLARLLGHASPGESELAAHLDCFFVAEGEEGIVGVIGLQCFGGDALLRSACIDRAWQGRGVGSALVEHVLTEAALQAIDYVYLLTSGAERFFFRFGFVEISPTDLPFTVRRAAEQAGNMLADSTPMQLRLVEP